jgi:hypothetical protein
MCYPHPTKNFEELTCTKNKSICRQNPLIRQIPKPGTPPGHSVDWLPKIAKKRVRDEQASMLELLKLHKVFNSLNQSK